MFGADLDQYPMFDKKWLPVAVLFCVLFSQVAVAQTWSSSEPVPRALHSAVLDPTTNRMIVFGGYATQANTGGTQNFNDVWRVIVTSSAWTQLKTKGTPPAPRIGHSAVYDSVSNRMIIFAGGEGRSSPCANDVWVLTNANGSGGMATWSQLAPSGTAPSARMQHGAVYNSTANSMIVYGGQDCSGNENSEVWVLSNANGVSGTPTWTQLSPSGVGPGAREIGQSIAYDSATNTLMVFGNGGTTGTNNDAWILSNADGQGGTPVWTQLSPSGTLPTARGGNSMTYDPSTNVATIFGGFDASGNPLSDVWALSNANGVGTPSWAQLATGSTYFPEARYHHTAVYSSTANKMTVFGGAISTSLFTNDIFAVSHANGH